MFSFDKKAPSSPSRAPTTVPGRQPPAKKRPSNRFIGPRPTPAGPTPARDTPQESVLTSLQRAFGADFLAVQVHRDNRADAAQALAVTEGEDVHLSPSVGPLSSRHAQRILAHELAHVLQQRAGAEGVAPHPVHRAESLAEAAASAVVRGGPIPALGAAPSGVAQHKKRPAPPGGGVLYIGMNNYKPEVTALKGHFFNTEVNVTTVTVSDTHGAFVASDDVYADSYDLSTAEGCFDFCRTLPTNGEVVDACAKILEERGEVERDDVAHVVQVYAQTEHDGLDRMSRVVLSGHSTGNRIYHHDDVTDISKGAVPFQTLVDLAKLFPKAAGQTRHLIVLGCIAGDLSSITTYYLKAFPNLITFSGWTTLSATGEQAGKDLNSWLSLTDPDPRTMLPRPATGRSNWVAGEYRNDKWKDDATLMAALRAGEAMLKKYFDGDKEPESRYAGELVEYYTNARIAEGRPTIVGEDKKYAQKAADRSFRLRYWKDTLARFWRLNESILSAAGLADISMMSRKQVMSLISTFLGSSAAGQAFGEAARLLVGLRDLDPNVVP